jgi:hypothetical protein
MAKNSYHVIAKSNGEWSVKRTGAERALRNFPTKKGAVTTARELVTKSGGGEIIIHEKDGRVSKRDSFSNDPNPPESNERSCVGSNPRLVKG